MARGTDFRGPISIPESQTIPVHAVQKEHLSDKKITRGWNLAKWCSFSVFGVGAVLFWISLLAPYFRWHPAWAGFSPQLMWIGILLFCLVLLSDWVYWRVVRHERYFIGRVTPRIAKTIFCIGVMTIFVWFLPKWGIPTDFALLLMFFLLCGFSLAWSELKLLLGVSAIIGCVMIWASYIPVNLFASDPATLEHLGWLIMGYSFLAFCVVLLFHGINAHLYRFKRESYFQVCRSKRLTRMVAAIFCVVFVMSCLAWGLQSKFESMKFQVSDFAINPLKVPIGGKVYISFKVKNISDTGGIYRPEIYLDGKPLWEREVWLSPGETKEISVDISYSEYGILIEPMGTHEVRVDGFRGVFTVCQDFNPDYQWTSWYKWDTENEALHLFGTDESGLVKEAEVSLFPIWIGSPPVATKMMVKKNGVWEAVFFVNPENFWDARIRLETECENEFVTFRVSPVL
jgi:hypothetical protein